MTLNKTQRREVEELGEALGDVGNRLVDAIASWDDTERDDREALLDEVADALREVVAHGETALGLAMLLA